MFVVKMIIVLYLSLSRFRLSEMLFSNVWMMLVKEFMCSWFHVCCDSISDTANKQKQHSMLHISDRIITAKLETSCRRSVQASVAHLAGFLS